MIRPCYIIAPYAGDVDRNVARACLLGRLALAHGLAPVVVHPAIRAGVYGDDDVAEERERGLAASIEVALLVVMAFGDVWVLSNDDGSLSDGCAREWRACGEYAKPRNRHGWRFGTWLDRRNDFEAAGLGEQWTRLR